ncbi:MAG: hypothetical protein KF764_31885 [Labilithrix sp.]|nr:hypothetical protein [Labilithrix sp.]
MSFVARRFGSAGLIPLPSDPNEVASATCDGARCPAPTASGVSLRSPVVLVVGVEDAVARACKATAIEADVGFVRAPQAVAACRAIRDARPTVVALGPSLWRDERHAIAEAARSVGACVVEIPPTAPTEWIALEVVGAAMTALAATG